MPCGSYSPRWRMVDPCLGATRGRVVLEVLEMALTKEQIKERFGYIGGSDAAAVLGLSRWKTPLEVWAEKTGQVEPKDLSDSIPIEVGNELEDLVCKMWTKRTGKALRRVNETLVHPNYPYIRGRIDRRVVGEDTIFEAKTASAWKAKEWEGEEIPQEYIIQCQHYMAITGAAKCEIAVLIGGNAAFVYKTIPRDAKIIAELVHREAEFWVKYVEPKVMPMIVTKNDSDILFELFPEGDDGEPVQLDDTANALIEGWEAMKQDLMNIKGQVDRQGNEIRALLKDKTVGVTDKYRVSWKNQITRRLDTDKLKDEQPEIVEKYSKVSKSRVLRIAALKRVKEAV